MTTPALETKRLLLPPVALRDAGEVQKHFSNWNVIQHIGGGVPWPYPADGATVFLRDNLLPRMAQGIAHAWTLRLRGAAGSVIGMVEFRLPPGAEPDRGFWLAEPWWRQGLMTEAVEAVNRFAFEVLRLDSFLEENAADNPASRRLKERSGAVYVGERHSPYLSGETRSEIWRITAAGWRAAQGQRGGRR